MKGVIFMDVSAMVQGLNIIDIVILAILLLSLVSGMYKGFLASFLATLGFAGAAVGAYLLCPKLANLFQSNNGLMNSLSYYIGADELLSKLADSPVTQAVQDSTLLSSATASLTTLPNAIVTAFRDNVVNQLFSTLNLSSLGDYLSQTVVVSLVYVISFLLLFAACYILALLVVNLFNNIFHFPLLRRFDWLLGGLFGLARGAFITILVLTVIPMLLSLMDLNILDDLIASSKFAAYFMNDNVLKGIISLGFAAK
ncbi:MAG: CvpA family protein [Christensenellales bacterium]|jgi:uncharacterized membrane protein required for colicin V production